MMMNSILLLGVDWSRDATLSPHFWPRAFVGGVALILSLILLDRVIAALTLPRQASVRGGGGGLRLRKVHPGMMMLALAPEPSQAREGESAPRPEPSVSISGFVETYLAWNFNRPESGVTGFRGFDARHNSFTISNAVLDARWTQGTVSGRLALQAGDTPDLYYGPEATGPIRHVLEATILWKAPLGRGLALDGGLFLSPIGPEAIPVKDNWTWSRSTLFYALPFYHAGFRARYPVTDAWTMTAGIYNGWNNVTDTNGMKSVSIQGLYAKPDKVTASFLYFGGVERPRGAAEGEPWRHLFDSHLTLNVSPVVSLLAHVDAGFEETTFGRASWRGGALAGRIKANPWLSVAVRADILDESVPTSSAGTATALFFPASRVQSLTATLDARPSDHMAARLEFRRDRANAPLYFKDSDPVASTRTQSTLTFGVTTWF